MGKTGKRKPASSDGSERSAVNGGTSMSRRIWLALAVCAVAAAAAMFRGTSTSSAVDDGIAFGLRKLARCAALCDRGTTAEDKKFSEGAIKRHGEEKRSQFGDLMKMCMWRCQEGLKKPHEDASDLPREELFSAIPESIIEYERAAKQCVEAGLRAWSDASTGLASCGAVHLSESFIDDKLLAQLNAAYSRVLADSAVRGARTDRGHIRAERDEFWPAFEPPFNDTALLKPAKLLPLLSDYLGSGIVLDHVTIINARATAKPEPQPLHADVGRARKHVEIHIPLIDVTQKMGPTMFCPASAGLSEGRESRTAAEYALEWWFFTPGKACAESSDLSYTRPLSAGQMTIYDANVFHAGTANKGSIDRPILQISWAADSAAIAERDYFSGSFQKDPAKRSAVLADIAKFRAAASTVTA